MSAPCVPDWKLLKRLGRYLRRYPRAVQVFVWQDNPAELTAYADSDLGRGSSHAQVDFRWDGLQGAPPD